MSEKHYISFGLEKLVTRAEKERVLKQHSLAFWMFGLSGSGKSTLAIELEKELFQRGYICQILDGDIIREGINKGLTFSEEDRSENIRRVAEVSKLFIDCGIITINCLVTPTEEMREDARKIIGKENILEIFVNSPLAICEERDPKGLYKLARRGEIKRFTGVDDPFDTPQNPDLIVDSTCSIQDTVQQLLTFILPKIEFKQH